VSAPDPSAAYCSECEGRREVPATPGQPGDGPIPCPFCSAAPPERERCRTSDGDTAANSLDPARFVYVEARFGEEAGFYAVACDLCDWWDDHETYEQALALGTSHVSDRHPESL